MRDVLISFLLFFHILSCSTKKESQNVILGADIALDCMLTSPIGDVPNNIYTVGNIEPTDKYSPFTKKLEVFGITLIARDEISNDFMENVGNTISEMFSMTSDTDLDMQRQVIESLYKYKTVIPLFYGEDWNISYSEENSWNETSSSNSLCDIIMEDIPNQVMEVVEHILHHVTDVGLHYAMNDDWGLLSDSELYRVTNDAIISGDYDIDQYSDIDEEDIRNRVILQEYAYWIIYTSWDLRQKYGPTESEWSIMSRNELATKQSGSYDLFTRTIPKVMTCPGDSILNLFEQ
jgi:hypothetical protein